MRTMDCLKGNTQRCVSEEAIWDRRRAQKDNKTAPKTLATKAAIGMVIATIFFRATRYVPFRMVFSRKNIIRHRQWLGLAC
ncbi:hypothetical protein HGP17_32420 [Rhizobium sp. P38BS-XIX]|uniref:hypothetical protein n=1 Tax=Rhizobium sp. P38BS-XIX TaxID=2726740 RepID=UPI0014576721|nr:hypothetical protein [Rhizobium sp. P38BS-XIX]NLS01564.1 hypothetical protein [Rhizobium sp. P38BS-XIX]